MPRAIRVLQPALCTQEWSLEVPSPLPVPNGSPIQPSCIRPCLFPCPRFGITHVDFWSLDVEGAELAVLSTVDWSRLTVNSMVVETDGLNATKDAEVVSLLEGVGFVAAERAPERARWTRNGQNTFFVHKRYLPIRKHAPGAERLYVEGG